MIPPLLEALLTATGPSGQETEAARAWRDGCSEFASEVAADHLPGAGGGPQVVGPAVPVCSAKTGRGGMRVSDSGFTDSDRRTMSVR